MKIADLNQKSDKELDTLIIETRKQIGQIGIEMRTKQVPNVKQIAALKKTVAQALTIQRQRQLKEENHGRCYLRRGL